MNFVQALQARWRNVNSLLCVGFDPDPARLPAHLPRADALFRFCVEIADATAPYACAFKPQIAYFAGQGREDVLEEFIDYLRNAHPGVPVVLDAKRGDIGSTAEFYAREAFERYRADAVTVSPYLGFDSVAPYTRYQDKGVIVLCRTSNKGGSDLQFLEVEANGRRLPLYQHVAHLVAERWNEHGNCGLVVGATFPDELAKVRAIVGDMPILVPGIGAQGGDIDATVRAGGTADGTGMLISSSRAILYAGSGPDYARAAATVARATRDAINAARAVPGTARH